MHRLAPLGYQVILAATIPFSFSRRGLLVNSVRSCPQCRNWWKEATFGFAYGASGNDIQGVLGVHNTLYPRRKDPVWQFECSEDNQDAIARCNSCNKYLCGIHIGEDENYHVWCSLCKSSDLQWLSRSR